MAGIDMSDLDALLARWEAFDGDDVSVFLVEETEKLNALAAAQPPATSNDVRDRITEIIDAVKTDDRPLDTTEYAAAIEQIMADAILADRGRRDVDPVAIAQQVLDAHAIRPHWRRSGEQIIPLIAEGIAVALGQPVAPQPTPRRNLLPDFDPQLLNAVYETLPAESAESPMPFVEVTLRVQRKHRYTDAEIHRALVILEAGKHARLQYGGGWSKVEAD